MRGANPRAELREQVLGDRAARGTRSILNIDPPDHTRIRGHRAEGVHAAGDRGSSRPRVQELVDEALDAAVAEQDGGEPGRPHRRPGVPAAVPGDHRDARHARRRPRPAARAGRTRSRSGSSRRSRRCTSTRSWPRPTSMIEHVLDAIEWKREHPADDLLTALIAAEHEGERLTPDELVDQVVLLFVAGPRDDRQPDRQRHARAAAQPGRARALAPTTRRSAPHAVDELLRYDAPVQFSRRVTTADARGRRPDDRDRARSCSIGPGRGQPRPVALGRRRRPRSTLTRRGRRAAPRVRVGHPPLPGRGAGPARGPARHRHARAAVPGPGGWRSTSRPGAAAWCSGASSRCRCAGCAEARNSWPRRTE